jgi:hypothetical protein
MRENSIDRRIGVWHVFGEHADGTVDVSDGSRDVFTELPRDIADKVIAAHDYFREELYRLLCPPVPILPEPVKFETVKLPAPSPRCPECGKPPDRFVVSAETNVIDCWRCPCGASSWSGGLDPATP